MTADQTARTATEGVWATLKLLKEHWVLAVFFLGALITARDTIDRHMRLPDLVGGLAAQVEALGATVARLDQVGQGQGAGDRSPVLAFPGTRHGASDAVPGQPSVVTLSPLRTLRTDCRPVGVSAHMVDSTGRWFAVDTDLAPFPTLTGDTDLAFGVWVHPRMARGHARISVQVAHDCGTHQQVDTAPWLHFTVPTAAPPVP